MATAVISQLPAQCDLRVVRGDDLTVTFDWSISLVGYTLHAVTTPADGTPVTLATPVDDAAAGRHRLIVPAPVTAAVSSPQTWKLWWVDPSGATLTVLAGQVLPR